MTDITLNDITSGYNVSRINVNFGVLEDVINNGVLHRVGGNNTMDQPLDMNSYSILNYQTDLTDPTSLITVGESDARYYNITGDTLEGPLNAGGNALTGLSVPTVPSGAVRKDQLDAEAATRASVDIDLYNGYTAGDANLQEQMTGNVPLEASAFSPISWHDQSVDNSVTIPDNKNAWSFGPTMAISLGQAVTIGTGSFWTIAEGELV